MLSLERCRKLIGSATCPDDAQLERLRQDLYALADVVVEGKVRSGALFAADTIHEKLRFVHLSRSSSEELNRMPLNERYELNERAAILEYDGGMSRQDAENQTFLEHEGRSKPGKQAKTQTRPKKSSDNYL